MKVPYFKHIVTDKEINKSIDVLKSGWLSSGVITQEFEKNFAKAVNAKHAIAVNSCTSALHLAVHVLGISDGDKVLLPSLTFASTSEVVLYKNAIPKFVDIDYDTRLISPKLINDELNKDKSIKYLIVVHFAGQSADMEEIRKICKKRNVRIIEDCAHAFPTMNNGKFIGSDSEAACFSFYANKTISTGEGGMFVTNSDKIAERVRTLRLHGINRNVWDRFTSIEPRWEYDIKEIGFKYNLPDLNSCIGLEQLSRSRSDRIKREKCAKYYFNSLKEVESIDLPVVWENNESHSWHLFTIVLNNKSKINRDDFIEELSKKNIGTSVHYKPLHLMSYYKKNKFDSKYNLHNTEKYWKGCVSLPIYPTLSKDQLNYVCKTITAILS